MLAKKMKSWNLDLVLVISSTFYTAFTKWAFLNMCTDSAIGEHSLICRSPLDTLL